MLFDLHKFLVQSTFSLILHINFNLELGSLVSAAFYKCQQMVKMAWKQENIRK